MHVNGSGYSPHTNRLIKVYCMTQQVVPLVRDRAWLITIYESGIQNQKASNLMSGNATTKHVL